MKLSIITVNLNNREGLRKTAQSILDQTFTDYEWIVVDGASTDGSVEVANEFAQKINAKLQTTPTNNIPFPIAHVISEPDTGIYNAMNKGILRSNGEYLQFLNSGDWLDTKSILNDVFHNFPLGDIVYGNIRFYKNGELIENRVYNDNLSFNYILNYSLGHCATFIKRRLFDGMPYDEELKIVSDWEFFIRQVLKNSSFVHINKFISCFDLSGISSCQGFIVQEEKQIVQRRYIPHPIQIDCENLSFYDSQFDNLMREIQSYRMKGKIFRLMISNNLHFMKFVSKFFK